MSEKAASADPWAVGECAKESVGSGDRRLGAALRALLVGVVFAVALSLAATVSYATLEQRLREQEAKLAELLERFGGALPTELDGLKLQRQPPNLPVSPRRRDAMFPAGSNRRPMLHSPDGAHNVVRRAADLPGPAPGQHSAQLVIKANKYHTVSSGFEELGYIEWDASNIGEPLSLNHDKWLHVNVGGLYYVYSQVTWRARPTTWRAQPTSVNGGILLHRIVMRTPTSGEQHRQRHHYENNTLAEGSVTLHSSRCRKSSIECPSQSSYTGGVFSLASGASLAVLANSSVSLTDKTFFGIYLLRSD